MELAEAEDVPGTRWNRGRTWNSLEPRTYLELAEAEDVPETRWSRAFGQQALLFLAQSAGADVHRLRSSVTSQQQTLLSNCALP